MLDVFDFIYMLASFIWEYSCDFILLRFDLDLCMTTSRVAVCALLPFVFPAICLLASL